MNREGTAIGTALLAASTLLAPLVARAETATESFAAGVDGGDVLGLGASLIMVVGAVLAAGWLYSRRPRGAGGNVIRILAAQPLGSKERIVLVDVGGTQMVLGMTTAQVQTLHVFEEPVLNGSDEPIGVSAFGERLRKLIKGQKP